MKHPTDEGKGLAKR